MAVTAAVVAVGATAVQYEETQSVKRATKRKSKAEARLAAIKRARERRKAQTAAVRARASAKAEAAARGAAGSSAAQGVQSSISAQAAERLGFSGVTEQIGKQARGFAQDAADAQGRAATAQAVAGLPSQIGLEGSFASLFDTDKKEA